jgi:hypothetical protein
VVWCCSAVAAGGRAIGAAGLVGQAEIRPAAWAELAAEIVNHLVILRREWWRRKVRRAGRSWVAAFVAASDGAVGHSAIGAK